MQLDKQDIKKVISENGFIIKEYDTFSRGNNFPKILFLDVSKNVGIIAIKC